MSKTSSPRGIAVLPILAVVLVLALLVVGGVYFGSRNQSDTNTPLANAPTNTAAWQTYTDPDSRFSMRYPTPWTPRPGSDSFPHAAVVFASSDSVNLCGCAVYVTIEANPQNLAVADWLADKNLPKLDSYISFNDYNAQRNSTDPTERQFAGQYSELPFIIGSIAGVEQRRSAEGGGYKRILLPRRGRMYVVTAWSDANYFGDESKQRDGGALARLADAVLASFQPQP